MKKLLLLLLFCSGVAFAQVRQTSSDQYIFRNSTTISLHDSATQPLKALDTLKLASAKYTNVAVRLKASASDTVTFISGGVSGGVYIFSAVADDSVITFLNSGTLKLNATRVLTKAVDRLSLYYNGTNWIELFYMSSQGVGQFTTLTTTTFTASSVSAYTITGSTTATDSTTSLILKDSAGKKWKIRVNTGGTMTADSTGLN